MNKLRYILSASVMMLAVMAQASDFLVDGFEYTITSTSSKTVRLDAYRSSAADGNSDYIGMGDGSGTADVKRHVAASSSTYSVSIPNTVTYSGITYSVTAIGDKAFYNKYLMSAISIPSSIIRIGDYVFDGCTNLTRVINYATSPQTISSTAFSDYVAELHVLKGCKDAYSNADYWKNFTIVDDIEISLSPKVVTLLAGRTQTISATINNDNIAVIWSSSDESVATVDADGVVTAVSLGSAVITATSVVDANINASREVNVIEPILIDDLIQNQGFDEDLTFQADGTMKTIISTDEQLSDRSYAYVAADGTCYCNSTSTTSAHWSRSNDSWASNGFIGQVQGWTLESNKPTSSPYKVVDGRSTITPEWVFFGTLPYALGATAIPISDNGSTYLAAPAKPAECDTEDNVGFAYLRAGWGGQAVYKQVVQLPCAQYRIEYWIYNANYDGSKNNTGCKNLCRVTCRNDVFEDSEGFNTQEWTKHTIEFTPISEFTIQFGFESSGSSTLNPFVCIDGIKLYKIGDADEAELLKDDILYMIESINSVVENNLSDCGGVVDEVAAKMTDFETIANGDDVEEMEQAYKDIKEYAQTVNDFITYVDEFKAKIEKASALATKEEYPGVDDFNTAIDKANTTLAEGTMAQIVQAEADLIAAVLVYYQSSSYDMGDINGDGNVTISDLSVLISYLKGENPDTFVKSAADVDGSMAIDANDIVALSKLLLGK